MKTKDRKHFDSYREQTRIKHIIVKKYIYAYFTILKRYQSNLVYIDGFAGRGTYEGDDGSKISGSPLKALETISESPDLAKIVSTVFFEKDTFLAKQLADSVKQFFLMNQNIREPMVYCGDFSNSLTNLVNNLENDGKKLAPTFLFVDPCGVDGVSFEVIKRFLDNSSAEALIFFNIDGVRRILGLGDSMGKALPTLLGSEESAKELLKLISLCTNPAEKERTIIEFYLRALKSRTKANYVVPFRVEYENKKATSHYLLHVTSHPMGFRIMKDVMWSVGKRLEGSGGLEFAQASLAKGSQLFDPQMRDIKSSILEILNNNNQVKVDYFTKILVEHPENMFSTKGYKEALVELESELKIQVLMKDGSGQLAKKRRAGTLADDYYLRIYK